MRPRLLHLGYDCARVSDRRRHDASMRPRLLHLGYDCERHTVGGEEEWASMRPRLLHLGYNFRLIAPIRR